MIGVIGAGAFGTALATILHRAGKPVILWGRNQDSLDSIANTQSLPKYLGATKLPDDLPISADISTLTNCRVLLLAIPVQKMTGFLDEIELPNTAADLIICGKGLLKENAILPSQLLQTYYPDASIMALSGPSFAVDLAMGNPTALTLAGSDLIRAKATQEYLSTDSLRLYHSDDLVGVQYCGAFKNVYAIGAGAVMGAGLGHSASAALTTRAFNELQHLIKALGGDTKTAFGLSGLGDLLLTTSSDKSRNYRFGFALGANQAWDQTITVEGAATAQALQKLAKAHNLDLPIANQVLGLIAGQTDVNRAIKTLMQRSLRAE